MFEMVPRAGGCTDCDVLFPFVDSRRAAYVLLKKVRIRPPPHAWAQRCGFHSADRIATTRCARWIRPIRLFRKPLGVDAC